MSTKLITFTFEGKTVEAECKKLSFGQLKAVNDQPSDLSRGIALIEAAVLNISVDGVTMNIDDVDFDIVGEIGSHYNQNFMSKPN